MQDIYSNYYEYEAKSLRKYWDVVKQTHPGKFLSDEEFKFLIDVYLRHKSAMGTVRQNEHLFTDIVKVKRNMEENCLEVYFRNGNWWHYAADKTWY